MISVELTNFTTDEVHVASRVPTELGTSSAVLREIEVSYDGGRLNVYCGSILVFSTMDAGIDFNVSIKPC